MGRSKQSRTIAILVAAALLVTGCGSGTPGDKVGAPAEPVTLRLGSDGNPGRPHGLQISEFARQVEERSNGQLLIETVWHDDGFETEPPPNDYPGWDQMVARMTVSGEYDLGLVPARAWDTEGVTSFRALHAPMLIDSEQLAVSVVEHDIAEEMLDGLEGSGVTGLALWPEGLRHLFFYEDPPASLREVSGLGLRAPRSATSYAWFEALGATPDDQSGEELEGGIRDGSIVAIESSFALFDPPGTALDVPLFPKVNSIVVNTEVFHGLGHDQQAVLRESAVAARDWAVANGTPTEEAAQDFCLGDGEVVAADGYLAELEAAARPVYNALEQDAQTADLIRRIRELAQQVAASAPVARCAGAWQFDDHVVAEGDQSVLDGVYRNEVTEQYLRSLGVTNEDDIAINTGIMTWTLEDGSYSIDWKSPKDQGVEEGAYELHGGRATFYLSWIRAEDPRGLPWTVNWEWSDEGGLVFTVDAPQEPLIDALFVAEPWVRLE